MSDRTAELDRSADAATRIPKAWPGARTKLTVSVARPQPALPIPSSHTAELGRVSDEAAARIEASIEGGTGRIEERLGTMDRALSIGLDNVSRTIEGKAAGLVTNLRGAVSDAAQGIDAEAVRSAELLAKAGEDFAQAMAARQADFQPASSRPPRQPRCAAPNWRVPSEKQPMARPPASPRPVPGGGTGIVAAAEPDRRGEGPGSPRQHDPHHP